MRGRTLAKLSLSLGLPLLLLGGAEWYLRTVVPACGVTPFRNAADGSIPAEFKPGFETLYKGHHIAINRQGFRGPDFPPPSPDTRRIAIIGDSFAFGSAVDQPDTIASRLQGALAARGAKAQTLNFGVPGFAAGDIAAVLESRALEQRPTDVIYVFFANDVEPSPEYGDIPEDAVIDAMHGYPLGSALMQWINIVARHEALAWFGAHVGQRTPELSEQEWKDGRPRVREAIQRMREACAAAGKVRFMVASYPFLTIRELNPLRPIDEGVAGVCEELGVRYLDLAEAFGTEADLSGYWANPFDSHPNGEANGKVAESLADAILSDAPR